MDADALEARRLQVRPLCNNARKVEAVRFSFL